MIIRDALTFLSLSLFTIALFSATLLLFRSFAAHRTELGRRWSARGAEALREGKPAQAVDSLRTALSYVPGERSYELLLAQALADAGHTDEAFNYFTGLWDSEPGNGSINLQLARLAARRRDRTEAVNYYRASLYGTWEGDGVLRRRDVRLELARYLLANHDVPAARAELLVAEGNADQDPALDARLGQLFQQVGDRPDALEAYLKATEADPKNPSPFASAGELAFTMGQFSTARRLLEDALRTASSTGPHPTFDRSAAETLLRKSDRILDLLPSRKLSGEQRVARLLQMRALAKLRLERCTSPSGSPGPEMQDLVSKWALRTRADARSALLRDPSRQDDLLQFIDQTELELERTCGPGTEDDEILVLLARDPGAVDR